MTAAREREASEIQEAIAKELVRLDRLQGRPVCETEGNPDVGPCRLNPETGQPWPAEAWCGACSDAGRALP